MIQVVFRTPDRSEHSVAAVAGTTLLEASRAAGIDIEGACGGNMACATCHVYVIDNWFGHIPKPSPEEEDMLDLASEWKPTSRLGCQVKLAPTLDGMVVEVPRSSLLDD